MSFSCVAIVVDSWASIGGAVRAVMGVVGGGTPVGVAVGIVAGSAVVAGL
jgi:hypothetical protein